MQSLNAAERRERRAWDAAYREYVREHGQP